MEPDRTGTGSNGQGAGDDAAQASPRKPGTDYPMISGVGAADGRIMVGSDIEIFPSRPRPDLASPDTRAFDVSFRGQQPGSYYALICSTRRLPRVSSIGAFKSQRNQNLLRLAEAGIVDWKPENRQRLALVFEIPRGRRLLPAADAKPLPLSPDRIVQALIMPVLSVLADLHQAGQVHGAITPENLFLTGAEGSETVVVGEGLSSAPHYRLHPFFETAERGMADPSGKGPGTIKDDLYALGMCVAMIARRQNLMAGRTPQQIIRDKIESGSYVLASGGERLPGGVSDFLRGILNDDENQRWDVEDALRWADGKRPAPKQPRVTLRAARPFVFKGEKYWDLRNVAMAMCANIPEAMAALEKDHFDLWVKRNFEDKMLTDRLEKLWLREKGSSKEKLMSALSLVLDPYAPIRYKNLNVFAEGFGASLAEQIAKGGDLQAHAEIINNQMFSTWYGQRFNEIPDAGLWVSTFEKCRNFMTQKMAGYGMERVLYMLNKDVCCMSPVLKDYVVLGPGGLLQALESIARRPDRPENILDRHMIAFISVREPKMIDPHLGHVISRDKGYNLVGIVRTLAAIQRRFNTGPVPAVGAWLISMINPAVDKFADRDLRQEISKRMGRLADTGNLAAILDLIDNISLSQDDVQRFALARREFYGLEQEKRVLLQQLSHRGTYGRATGRQVAMLASAFLSSMCILGYLMLRLTTG
jgi:hypothetical protein